MIWSIVAISIAVLTAPPDGNAGPHAAAQAIDAAIAEMRHKAGNEYSAARSKLLAMNRNEVAACLDAKHSATTDPLERLQLEALLARVRDPERLDKARSDALECARSRRSTSERI